MSVRFIFGFDCPCYCQGCGARCGLLDKRPRLEGVASSWRVASATVATFIETLGDEGVSVDGYTFKCYETPDD